MIGHKIFFLSLEEIKENVEYLDKAGFTEFAKNLETSVRIGVIQKTGSNYAFPHKSIAEYFAGLHLHFLCIEDPETIFDSFKF